MKKLNAGCGNIPLIGYTNIDKYYCPGSTNKNLNKELARTWNSEHFDSPWIYGDIAELEFENEEFDEIIIVHALEHLSMNDGNKAIGEAIRVLKKGGFLEIEVPDLIKACEYLPKVHIKKNGDNELWFRIMGLFYGTTGSDGEGQFHLCGYSKEYLKYKMEEHKLINITEIPVGFGHGKPEPQFDFRMRGYKE